MKKIIFILLPVFAIMLFTAFAATKDIENEPIYIPESIQRNGDAATGYQYLITGDFLKSGVPYKYYTMMNGKDTANYLHRTGKNATVGHGFNVVTANNDVDIVIPTCLQCHAQLFEGKLVVGLGNTFLDFSNTANTTISDRNITLLKMSSPKSYDAAKTFIRSFNATYPNLQTEVRGVNPADALATILVAHRDARTLVWSNDPLMALPDTVIPTDVPAWWLMKKKHAMFYNGFGRGDFGKFLMLSNILTVSDSSEAREVNSHFGDVLAFIRSVQPPSYPGTINKNMAVEGKVVFTDNCSRCHGTYGAEGTYPNLLIPGNMVGTDSLLFKANQQNNRFVDWFNKSWFAQGGDPANLVPYNGYIAPPLDGIWVTAPYFHNGSVPTLEGVLNSKVRPRYWSRDFEHPVYNYDQVGWKYENHNAAIDKKVYNTSLPGYGNYGHYFGDPLSEKERKALIEYLKTL